MRPEYAPPLPPSAPISHDHEYEDFPPPPEDLQLYSPEAEAHEQPQILQNDERTQQSYEDTDKYYQPTDQDQQDDQHKVKDYHQEADRRDKRDRDYKRSDGQRSSNDQR